MFRLAPILAASAFVLAGCAGGSNNDADVTFAQQMVPHHEQALEMSALALDDARGASAEVRDLATRIEQAQQPEIDTLDGWLEDWGADRSDAHSGHGDMGGGDMGGGDMGGGDEMTGMMSAEQMSELEQAQGADFDRLWLELMIAHHEGAVEMAETEIADGQDPDATALAREIVDAQQGEITEMKELLR